MNFADYFYYDESSPSCLRWKVSTAKHIAVNSPAGNLQSTGYFKVQLKGKTYYVHRIVYALFNNDLCPKLKINHIDLNPSNSRIGNLEQVTTQVNNLKSKKQVDNSCGVFEHNNKGRFYACCSYSKEGAGKKYKYYSYEKYGILEAIAMAFKFRQEALNWLKKGTE